MHVRYPIWLRTAQERPGANVFAALFALESIARALLATVVTVQALAILGDPRDVSLLFAAVGLTGLASSFLIPTLVARLSRRWCYTLGAVLLALAPVALGTLTLSGQLGGMLMRVFGVACLNIVLSLYILQYIDRRMFTVSEPRRLVYSAFAWAIGPALGVWLYARVGPHWAYGASAFAAGLLLALFWVLRLRENPAVAPATAPPPSPVHSVRRFLAQPRLRLAWLIAFTRSSWWTFFFIYTPVWAVRGGYGEMAGALLISGGNALLFLTPFYGRLAERIGVRRLIMASFVAVGLTTILGGVAMHEPIVVAATFAAGALGCVALDAVGNIPFLRAVRVHQRAQMTTVFRTYIDASELLPPTLFAVLLTFFDLPAVFVAQGLFVLSAAWWVRYLPRGI